MGKVTEEMHPGPQPEPANRKSLDVDPQRESMLFQRFPQEIRDEIYSCLFCSTRLTWSLSAALSHSYLGTKPGPNALAILQTCRRAKNEIGDTWVGQILFNFEGPRAMLDKLTAMPPGVLSKVRHVQVLGHSLHIGIAVRGVSYAHHYSLASALKLLPGLCLDTLTVRGTPYLTGCYDILYHLVTQSCGWKELHYIFHSLQVYRYTTCGIFLTDDDDHCGKPPLAHWQRALEERDSAESNPSVVSHSSTVSNGPWPVINADTRSPFKKKVPELSVIAKRGTGVDYEEREDSPFIDDDIRQVLPGLTWTEICRRSFDPDKIGDENSILGYDKEEEDPRQDDGDEDSDESV